MGWKDEFFRIITILNNNGISVKDIRTRKTVDGKRFYITIRDIKQDIDIETIIHDNNLSPDYPIGNAIKKIRALYKHVKKTNSTELSEEELKILEEMDIVEEYSAERESAVLYGRKITQFHLDIVTENLDKILSGELNTLEVLALINKQAIEHNQTQIRDSGTVKRIMAIILKDRPEELEKYLKSLKHNTGRRTPKGVKRATSKGTFSIKKDQEFIRRIIEEYLPKILTGEVTVKELERELHSSNDTINGIIEEYYKQRGDEVGLQQFRTVKMDNVGSSPERRAKARQMRQEVEESDRIVNNKIFLTLSPEEQDRQIILKIRKEQLKEEKKNGKTIVTTEETTKASVERIKNYFRSKNDPENELIYFTEQDIRHMIFMYPTIRGHNSESLDEKIEVLTSYDEIDEQTAYGMIKSFPAIMGYSPERTKAQLELLQRENLIVGVIDNPRLFMNSIQLMYAQIQFAKERHHVDNLDNVSISNIFVSGATLIRCYNTTKEEIKKRFPYPQEELEEVDEQLVISGQDIGRATYRDVQREHLDEAEKVLVEIVYRANGRDDK